MKISPWIVCGALALASCASALTDAGRKVMVVTPLSATEAERFEEIGPLDCTTVVDACDIEPCRNMLRNKAASLGASVLVLETNATAANPATGCAVRLKGRAYRLRAL